MKWSKRAKRLRKKYTWDTVKRCGSLTDQESDLSEEEQDELFQVCVVEGLCTFEATKTACEIDQIPKKWLKGWRFSRCVNREVNEHALDLSRFVQQKAAEIRAKRQAPSGQSDSQSLSGISNHRERGKRRVLDSAATALEIVLKDLGAVKEAANVRTRAEKGKEDMQPTSSLPYENKKQRSLSEISDMAEDFLTKGWQYLTKNERLFYENVLKKGECDGVWIINKFIAGGTLGKQGALGYDFEVQSQNSGVILKIEFKHHELLRFTPSQLERFRMCVDTQKSVTRLCYIQPYSRKIPGFARKVLYLSPKFLQSLPNNFFVTQDLTHINLKWQGLDEYLMQNKENTLFEVVKGEFGTLGVKYKPIPMSQAYDWLYRKLCTTLENPLEDCRNIFSNFSSKQSRDEDDKIYPNNQNFLNLLTHSERKFVKNV
ncbi:MAG: hypothetical protein HWN65_17250 [Candidatus Helarchaeota archaeon]|nr:hypothetical protein [Candidatus Helarchaeota archaeon]